MHAKVKRLDKTGTKTKHQILSGANVYTHLTNVHIILKLPCHSTGRGEDGCSITVFIIVDYFHGLKSQKI